MFGHHRDHHQGEDVRVEVDLDLERVIAEVRHTVGGYLDDPGEAPRGALRAALDRLDRQTAASDAYQASIVDSGVFGVTSKGSVIGETSSNPMTEELPATVLDAQVALVRAAKDALATPGPASSAALREAVVALDALDPPDTADPTTGGPPDAT